MIRILPIVSWLLISMLVSDSKARGDETPREPWPTEALDADTFGVACSELELELALGSTLEDGVGSFALFDPTVVTQRQFPNGESWIVVDVCGIEVGFLTTDNVIRHVRLSSRRCSLHGGLSIGSSVEQLEEVFGDSLRKAPGRGGREVLAVLSLDPVHGYASTIYSVEFFITNDRVEEVLVRNISGA